MEEDKRKIRGNEKREALIAAATALFHQKSYADVSTKEVAKAAGLKQGHLTYYFISKRALGLAVLEAWKMKVEGGLAEIDHHKNPKTRLLEFIRLSGTIEAYYMQWGCPIANLTDELLRESTAENRADVPLIYELQLAWFIKQCVEMGLTAKQARYESEQLLCALQGAVHVGYVLGKPTIFEQFIANQTRHIKQLGKNI